MTIRLSKSFVGGGGRGRGVIIGEFNLRIVMKSSGIHSEITKPSTANNQHSATCLTDKCSWTLIPDCSQSPLSHYHSVPQTIPFVNRLSCIFCSPPRWTHLHYSSLHCVRTRQGRALTLEISSPATNSCSLQKNMQSVVVKEGGRKQILLPLEMLCHRGCAQGYHG